VVRFFDADAPRHGPDRPEPADREPTPPADGDAWQGKGGRRLDAAQNEEIDLGYARIREVGEKTIIPGVLSAEAEDPTRRLADFDKCFKGADRLKEKIADLLEPSPERVTEDERCRFPAAARDRRGRVQLLAAWQIVRRGECRLQSLGGQWAGLE
jgi:hypothetical protein